MIHLWATWVRTMHIQSAASKISKPSVRGKECANLFKHNPFMDLYLINAATDAKRQPCLDMIEASIWYLSVARVQVGSRKDGVILELSSSKRSVGEPLFLDPTFGTGSRESMGSCLRHFVPLG